MLFFFNDTATTEIYTLSLHDALPISIIVPLLIASRMKPFRGEIELIEDAHDVEKDKFGRSEEHTSELQSHHDLVCRLLLEKKKHTQ